MDRTIKGIYLIWVSIHLSIALIFSDGILNSHNWDDGYKDFFTFVSRGYNPDKIYDEEAHIKYIYNSTNKSNWLEFWFNFQKRI